MEKNGLATEARDAYADRPWYGGRGNLDPGWMYGGLSITRDSDPLETSNYRTAAQMYRDAGVEVSPSSFNHWAVGYIEYLDVRISSAATRVLVDIVRRLADYPVLDDEDFSQAEWDHDHPSDGRCYSTSEEDYYEPCPCGLPRD